MYGTNRADFDSFGVCLYGTGLVQVWYKKPFYFSLIKEKEKCTILVRLAKPPTEILRTPEEAVCLAYARCLWAKFVAIQNQVWPVWPV